MGEQMTAGELIAQLQKVDPSTKVVVTLWWDESYSKKIPQSELVLVGPNVIAITLFRDSGSVADLLP